MTAETLSPRTTSWTIDASHSVAEFSVKHMMISNVKGSFNKVSGNVSGNIEEPESISINAEIDINSIFTNDEKRDAHLRSADFFDTEKYPSITFTSTKVIPVKKDTFQVIGELSMHGITRPVTLDVNVEGPAKDPWGNQRYGLEATTSVNRKEFDLNWNVALEAGGVLVGEQVKITLHVQLIGQNS